MPTYEYAGRTTDGEIAIGEIEAESRLRATILLRQRGVEIDSLSETAAARPPDRRPARGFWVDYLAPIPPGALASFWHQFSDLLQAGVGIREAVDSLQGRVGVGTRRSAVDVLVSILVPILLLRAVIEGIGAWRMRLILRAMMPRLAAGESFAALVRDYPGVFPDHVVGMVQAATTSGDLGDVARDIAEQYDQEYRYQMRVAAMKLYMVVIVILCILIAPIPQIFIRNSAAGTEITQSLQEYTELLLTRLIPIIARFLALLFAAPLVLNQPALKPVKDAVGFHLPVLRGFVIVSARWRFLRSLQVLIRAGVPLSEAVEGATEAIGNEPMAGPYREAAARMRRTGAGIEALVSVPTLTPEMRGALQTAEQAGTWDAALERLTASAAEQRQSLANVAWLVFFVAGYALVTIAVAVVVALGFSELRNVYMIFLEED